MFLRFTRATVVPVWLALFGLLALLWSPRSVAIGVLLLMVGLAAPSVMLILSSEGSATLARVGSPADRSQRAR